MTEYASRRNDRPSIHIDYKELYESKTNELPKRESESILLVNSGRYDSWCLLKQVDNIIANIRIDCIELLLHGHKKHSIGLLCLMLTGFSGMLANCLSTY